MAKKDPFTPAEDEEMIIVEVGRDLKTTVTVKNVKGGSCIGLAASIENGLGTVEQITHTPEYNQREDSLQRNQTNVNRRRQ